MALSTTCSRRSTLSTALTSAVSTFFHSHHKPLLTFTRAPTAKHCKDKPHTNVVSISYGTSESGPHNEMIRQCNEMGKVALTGVTFVYASGDDGPSVGGTCLDDDGNEVDGEGNFFPDFPGVCQYLTAVGATQVNPGSSVRHFTCFLSKL